MNGALLVHKPQGITSFGVIEQLQRKLMADQQIKKKDLPKLGHGGTLDPFATGLLIVLVGKAVKLARYFLGSTKTYEGSICFGRMTSTGDPTSPVTESCEHIPTSLTELQKAAHAFTLTPYLQIPPMYSAKKREGKKLYELARAGIEVDREPKECQIDDFKIFDYEAPRVHFEVKCSSGTYVRTLAQDLARTLGTLGLLETLHRSASGAYSIESALTLEAILNSPQPWKELPCWVPFNALLKGYPSSEATQEEAQALIQGKQHFLAPILKRAQDQAPAQAAQSSKKEEWMTIYCQGSLVAISKRENGIWELERVFT